MGNRDGLGSDLTVYAEADGTISVDVGQRFVAVGTDDLERILDRLASDGGTRRLVRPGPGSREGRHRGPRGGLTATQ
jgi:hypothetical protein